MHKSNTGPHVVDVTRQCAHTNARTHALSQTQTLVVLMFFDSLIFISIFVGDMGPGVLTGIPPHTGTAPQGTIGARTCPATLVL